MPDTPYNVRRRLNAEAKPKFLSQPPTSSTSRTDEMLLSWHEIPTWQRDNEFILSGYRVASASSCRSLKSFSHTHNETINVYSHLFGAAVFVVLPCYEYATWGSRYTVAHKSDVLVFSVFFTGIVICFLLSACFHIMSNHSEQVTTRWNQIDYLGIVCLMWSSTIPSIYYGFYCNPDLQRLYWSAITVLAVACTYATLSPSFFRPHLRPFRAAMYSALGLSAIVYVSHGLLLHGWEVQKHRMGLVWMGRMGALNLVGAVVYATRIPERWHPGKYDICGASHQILHVMVVLAGLTHLIGLLEAFDSLHEQINPFTCDAG